jgi:benzodiazapine receptor
MMGKIAGLIGSLIICFAAAGLGAMATQRAPEFYATLSQPSWAPPSSLFGPVWSALYTLMAIAAWLVWMKRDDPRARGALGLFLTQLVFNALWSWIFFAWQRGALAQIEIVTLVALIVMTVVAFWRVRPLAGALMLPYLAWVSFATALTFALVRNNPGVL